LDSGVWISALEFEGVSAQALVYAQTRDKILICTQVEDEVVRVLGIKFGMRPIKVRRRLAVFLKGSVRVTVTGKLAGIRRDPKDDFILECAENGNADLIVTGDKDLLSLERYGATKIVTPRQYLDGPQERSRHI
jgi:putative PIN family toxin of toxin-antitoxin system